MNVFSLVICDMSCDGLFVLDTILDTIPFRLVLKVGNGSSEMELLFPTFYKSNPRSQA